MSGFRVCKFGGTSVANADCVKRAVQTIINEQRPCVVVVSAMGGVTNRLLESADRASTGNLDFAKATAGDLRKRHEELIDELFGSVLHANATTLPPGTVAAQAAQHSLIQMVRSNVSEFERICESLAVLGDKTPRILDVVVSRGERMLAQIFARSLELAGCAAVYVDATELLFVQSEGGYLSPVEEKCSKAMAAKVLPALRLGKCVVVPGFIAQGAKGEVVTLGRGGSDYSATIFAGLIEADSVTLYKEVDGLLTADPRFVPDARVIPELHYREATELAFYGAKVLHPRTIIPLMKSKIPLVVKNSFRPEFPGTRICAEPVAQDFPVKALTAISGQALITIQGNGMMGVPGIAGRTFSALAQSGLSTSFISQASSESSICFVVPAAEVEEALHVLRQCFRLELEHGLIDDVFARTEVAVAAVVGQGMRGHTGVAARTMLAISQAGANIIAIAQGSSELNISVAIDEKDISKVLRSLHREYRLHEMAKSPERREHQANIVIFGVGQIGGTLARQLADQQEFFRQSLNLDLRVVGLANSKRAVMHSAAFSVDQLRLLCEKKGMTPFLQDHGGLSSSELLAMVAPEESAHFGSNYLGRNIFVDCTATESYAVVKQALKSGSHVVLANKKPLATMQSEYNELFDLADSMGLFIRFEATVGAGLPVLDTLAKLLASGDQIYSIAGCLSGTLGFLMTRISDGAPFSEAVCEAWMKGYTEPDPRDDLSGKDVARKAIILARYLGYSLELSDIAVEPLYPESASDADPKKFISNLRLLDDEIEKRVLEAAAQGCVLRYVAEINALAIGPSGHRVVVGVKAVPSSGPMGMLRGTDNQVCIRSRRYDQNPLVVTGPGAGAEVTAAGVLNDIVALSQFENMHSQRAKSATTQLRQERKSV